MDINKTSLDTLCGALCKIMDIEPPATAAAALTVLICLRI